MTYPHDPRIKRWNFEMYVLAYEANAHRKLLPTNIKHYLRLITGKDDIK